MKLSEMVEMASRLVRERRDYNRVVMIVAKYCGVSHDRAALVVNKALREAENDRDTER